MRIPCRLTIGVLCGGQSIEREVSFNSGRTICDHLDTERFRAVPLFQASDGLLYILPPHFLHRGKISDFEQRLSTEAQRVTWDELPQCIDFVFITLHGRYGEDGAVQGMLELLQIPYFGAGVGASALGMDKVLQRPFLASAGISLPRAAVLEKRFLQQCAPQEAAMQQTLFAAQLSHLTYPLVIKPAHEGSSLGISVVKQEDALREAIWKAAYSTPWLLQPVICEEKIEGMEFSCIIITDNRTGEPAPLPVTEIVPEQNHSFFDYEQKYMPGRGTKYTPARCTPEQQQQIQQTCIRAMHALGITSFARIDGFLTPKGNVIIIDTNSLGGMAPSSFTFLQAAEIGLSHTALINHLVDTGLIAAGILPPEKEHSMNNIEQKRTRVAVLMGGASAEREVSLESGRNITYKLSPHKYEPVPLFVDQQMRLYRLDQKLLVKNSTAEIAAQLDAAAQITWNELSTIADFVFIALHGGKGENGCVQGALELLGLAYNGSSVATSALCMDKERTCHFLAQQGFTVPAQLLLKRPSADEPLDYAALLAEKQLHFPLIVKPHDDGCSVLVQRATDLQELEEAVTRLFAEGRSHALIETYLTGMELTVGVLGNDDPIVLPPSYAVAAKGILSIEEKFLPGAGENQTPAPLPPEALLFVQETIRKVYRAIDCQGYARIDCFYESATQSSTGSQQLTILEINTLPGMTPATCIFHQAAEVGIRPMEFIDRIITLGQEAHPHSPPMRHHSSLEAQHNV